VKSPKRQRGASARLFPNRQRRDFDRGAAVGVLCGAAPLRCSRDKRPTQARASAGVPRLAATTHELPSSV